MSGNLGTLSEFAFAAAEVPLVLTAVHAGHRVRPELLGYFGITEADRLREEDPFTDTWIPAVLGPACSAAALVPGRVVVHQSRFECDMNRPRETAVYLTPEQAWGLRVWRDQLPAEAVDRSRQLYDRFYSALEGYFDDLYRKFDAILVLDVHSYNHRRSGPNAAPAPEGANPDYNLGTATVADRRKWEDHIQTALQTLLHAEACDRSATVGENVKFGGGHMARWLHHRYGSEVCVLSLEVKKFFMNEWTGHPDADCLRHVKDVVEHLCCRLLERM